MSVVPPFWKKVTFNLFRLGPEKRAKKPTSVNAAAKAVAPKKVSDKASAKARVKRKATKSIVVLLEVTLLYSAPVLKFDKNEFLDVEQSVNAFSTFLFDCLNPPLTGWSLAHRFVCRCSGQDMLGGITP